MIRRHIRITLSYRSKLAIRKKIKKGLSCAFIAREYGVTRQAIWYTKQQMLLEEAWMKKEGLSVATGR